MSPEAQLDLLAALHVNAVVDGFEAGVACFTELFEGQLLKELQPDGDLQACLVALGPMIYELFAPAGRERGYGKLLGRYGPYWHGVEFKVPDLAHARRVLADRGIRLLTEVDSGPNSFVTTQPNDTGGLALELFAGDWFADPPPMPYVEPLRDRRWWAEEHPLGLLGLRSLSLATTDLDQAAAFWCSLTGTNVAYREARSSVAAEVAGLPLGDTVLELACPGGPGPVADHLAHHGPRLRSVVYQAADIGAVERFFKAKGVATAPGETKESLTPDPAATLGLQFEFTSAPPQVLEPTRAS